MFDIGEYVVYGSKGVCEVTKVGPIDIPGMSSDRNYYTLTQMGTRGSTIFVPVDKEDSGLRYVLSREEVNELICDIPSIKPIWIQNDKEREQIFTENIRKADTRQLVEMMIALHDRKERRIADGKKATSTDERYFHAAEDILYGEIEVVLGVDRSEAKEILWHDR